MEIAIAESCAFYGFDLVVAAFGEAVGIGAVKGVEDVGLPVLQHGQDRDELRQVGQRSIHPKRSEPLLSLLRRG